MKKPFASLMLLVALLTSFSAFSLPKLSSLPTASATIYLDFDGEYINSGVWNGGTPFYCAAPTLTDAQITEIFNRVSEDYRPFEVNITTDSAVFVAAPIDRRVRVVVTPTSAWFQGVGGVSYVGSFTWGDDTPAFVFPDRLGNATKLIAECCSHESGHSLGLSHQSKFDASCNLTAMYNDGTGSGEIGWAPIMGNSYNRNMSGWSDGPTPYGCSYKQDNLSIITSQNGFTYRTDDYSDNMDATATVVSPVAVDVDGVIATTTDKDVFKFSLGRATAIKIAANPFSVGTNNNGANLDLRAQLYTAAGALVRLYDPAASMSVSIDTTLPSGDYYIVVDGAGNSNVSDYGSLGSYKLKGSSIILPIRSVELSGKVVNDKHELNWNIISDEPIKSIAVEASADGTNFKPVSNVSASAVSYSYVPFESGVIYYRLKVTSTIGETVYSNVFSLKAATKSAKAFSVSTLVYSDITVSANANYQYQITDNNGRVIARGNGLQGVNKIAMYGMPRGMYVLQLMNNSDKQIERIIKQ